jgi:hypothetical protein
MVIFMRVRDGTNRRGAEVAEVNAEKERKKVRWIS